MSSTYEQDWLLDPGLIYLNHGSFGACPRVLLAQQRHYQEQLERHPVQFFLSEYPQRLQASKHALAKFVGADAEDIAFVTNATAAANTVLRSLDWQPGEHLLTTNHAYNACRNALDFVAQRWKLRVIVVDIPFPLQHSQQVVDTILSHVTPQTRFALIDAITSATGLIFPFQTIVHELARRGVDTFVDGAHAPGMIPLDLNELGAAYFTGNCHKWMCTPKGSAFLHVRRDRQASIRPLIISHGANETLQERSRFEVEFDWQGTVDASAALCIPDAIAWGEQVIAGGWSALMQRNRELALRGQALLCKTLGVDVPAPAEMIGSLATIPLPNAPPRNRYSAFERDPLQVELLERYRIEVPVYVWPTASHRWLRISAQLYNTYEQYERLASALQQLL